MEIATSRGVSVLAVFMMGVLRRGSDAANRSRLVLYRRMGVLMSIFAGAMRKRIPKSELSLRDVP